MTEKKSIDRENMICDNLGLVYHAIRLYGNSILQQKNPLYSSEDLYQEGVTALIRAVDSYDPARLTSFSTYAMQVIRNHFQSLQGETLKDQKIEKVGELDDIIYQYIGSQELTANQKYSLEDIEQLCSTMSHISATHNSKTYEIGKKVTMLLLAGYQRADIMHKLHLSKKQYHSALTTARYLHKQHAQDFAWIYGI